MARITIRLTGRGSEGVKILQRELPAGASVKDFMTEFAGELGQAKQMTGYSVLVNGQSAPKKTWGERFLEDGDVVAIFPMLVGG